MIVKVQRSLNDGGKSMLIYNREKTVQYQETMCSKVDRMMGTKDKVFAKAKYDKQTKRATLLSLVFDQGW